MYYLPFSSCFLLKPATEDSRDMKNMQDTTRVYGLFCILYAASRDRFLVSRFSNCLVVKAVIMHETTGFSHVVKDKIIVRENNPIAKHR